MSNPLATIEFTELGVALDFLKRVHAELRMLRKVHVWTDQFRVFDVNGDCFEIRGIGYSHPDIVPILRAVHTVFDPATIHEPTPLEFKEFLTGRRRPWAEDRVM